VTAYITISGVGLEYRDRIREEGAEYASNIIPWEISSPEVCLSESILTPIVINVAASNLDGESVRIQVTVPKEIAEAVRRRPA
jgi:hypothetical protein